MKIEIIKPHPDYPFAYIHVGVGVDVDRPDLSDLLAKNQLTLLDQWEPHFKNGSFASIKAPVLLEDEHQKPRKHRKTAAKTEPKKVSIRAVRK